MSEAIQITLIVCGTILILSILTLLFMKSVISKEFKRDNKSNIGIKRDTERFGYCKSPTYQRPPRPYSREPNTSSAEKLKNIKPPSTGSGIK